MVFIYHWILLTRKYVLRIVIQQLGVRLLRRRHLMRPNVDARDFLLVSWILVSCWLTAMEHVDVENIQRVFRLVNIMRNVLQVPVLNWGARSWPRPRAIPRKNRTGRHWGLSQRKTSLCLDLKWLLVLILIGVVLLGPKSVLAAYLKVLTRWTHLHLNAVFVFGVFVFCAHAFQVIPRLLLVLIFASLVIGLDGIVGDCV
jgi:hypothetical protein